MNKNKPATKHPAAGDDGVVRLRFATQVRLAGDGQTESRAIDVIASTATVDSHESIVVQDFDLERYTKNPVVLWNHGMGASYWGDSQDTDLTLPIGFATNVKSDGQSLTATLNFVDEKANPIAEKVWQGFKQGSIRAVSIGFWSKDVRFEKHDDKEILVLSQNELLEISPVAIPSNPDAIAQSRSAMIDKLKARARSRSFSTRSDIMDKTELAKLLGLDENASEDEIKAKIEDMKAKAEEKAEDGEGEEKEEKAEGEGEEKEPESQDEARALRSILSSTGSKTISDAAAKIVGLKFAADNQRSLADRVRSLETEVREHQIEKMLEQASKEMRLAPAMRSHVLAQAGADKSGKGADIRMLKSILACLPVQASSKFTETPKDEAQDELRITPEQARVYELAGVTPDQVKKSIAKRSKPRG